MKLFIKHTYMLLYQRYLKLLYKSSFRILFSKYFNKSSLVTSIYTLLIFTLLSFTTSGYVYKKRKKSRTKRPVYTIEDITYDNHTYPAYIQGYTKTNNILAPKIGVSISSFTSCILQCSLFKPQFGIMGAYRITPNIGIHSEISIVTKGTRDMPLDLHMALKKISDKEDETESLVEQGKEIIKKKIIFKDSEYYSATYINIPIALCLSFKGHHLSRITNHLIMGGYVGYLIKATRKRYKRPPLEIDDDKKIYEAYKNPTKSQPASTKGIRKFEFGYLLGYMFESAEGIILGIKYSESLNNFFRLDKRDFELTNRNMSIELFFAFNVLSLL